MHNSQLIASRMMRSQRYIFLAIVTIMVTFLIITSSSAHTYIKDTNLGKSLGSYVDTAKSWANSNLVELPQEEDPEAAESLEVVQGKDTKEATKNDLDEENSIASEEKESGEKTNYDSDADEVKGTPETAKEKAEQEISEEAAKEAESTEDKASEDAMPKEEAASSEEKASTEALDEEAKDIPAKPETETETTENKEAGEPQDVGDLKGGDNDPNWKVSVEETK